MKEPTSAFGQALRTWRKANEMSGAALGARLKVTAATVSGLELGTAPVSEKLLEALRKLGLDWPPAGGVAVATPPVETDPEEKIRVPLVSKQKPKGGQQYTEAELNSRPWANNNLTLRQFLNSQQLVVEAYAREEARWAIPDLRNATYVESFFRFRDSPANFHWPYGAEKYAPLREAIATFLGQLLASWQSLPLWQRKAIKEAVEESLRVNEKWLETQDRFIDRGDILIGSRLTQEVQVAFEALAAIPEPELVRPATAPRLPYQPAINR